MAQARGQETKTVDESDVAESVDANEEVENALALFKAAAGDVQVFDPRKMAVALKRGGFVMAERFMKLAPNQMIEGWLVGKGPAVIQDINTGKDKEVTRFKIELTSGARVSLLETTQLLALNELPIDGSCAVIIARGGTSVTAKQRKMDEYYITYALGNRKPLAALAASASE